MERWSSHCREPSDIPARRPFSLVLYSFLSTSCFLQKKKKNVVELTNKQVLPSSVLHRYYNKKKEVQQK